MLVSFPARVAFERQARKTDEKNGENGKYQTPNTLLSTCEKRSAESLLAPLRIERPMCERARKRRGRRARNNGIYYLFLSQFFFSHFGSSGRSRHARCACAKSQSRCSVRSSCTRSGHAGACSAECGSSQCACGPRL